MVFRRKAKKAPAPLHVEERGAAEETGAAMGWAEDMRNLAQEIVTSYDARVAGVAALKQETAAKLKGFRQEMKNVQHELRRKAANLKRFLSHAAASRLRNFRAMHGRIRVRQEERNGEVAGMLGGFRRENEAAASHWQHMAATMAKRRASAAR